MSNLIFLEGNIVTLCPLTSESDYTNYLKWLNNQDTTQYLEVGNSVSTKKNVQEYVEKYNNSKNLLLGIFLKNTGEHVGNITLHMIDGQNRSAETGILVGEESARGCGCATEAIKLILGHAFMRLNLNRISAGMVGENVASKRLFEKVGFTLEGTLREAFYLNGKYHDCYRYGILRKDYITG